MNPKLSNLRFAVFSTISAVVGFALGSMGGARDQNGARAPLAQGDAEDRRANGRELDRVAAALQGDSPSIQFGFIAELQNAKPGGLPELWRNYCEGSELGKLTMLTRILPVERYFRSLLIEHWVSVDPQGAVEFLSQNQRNKRSLRAALEAWARSAPEVAIASARDLSANDAEALGKHLADFIEDVESKNKPITAGDLALLGTDKAAAKRKLGSWTAQEPHAALAWARESDDADFLKRVIRSWPKERYAELRDAFSLPPNDKGIVKSLAALLANRAPELALEWAKGVSEEMRSTALSQIIDHWNPHPEYRGYFETLPAEELLQIRSLGSFLLSADLSPSEAWQWAGDRGEPTREHMLERSGWDFAERWYSTDPIQALQTLRSLPPSEGTERFAKGIGTQMAHHSSEEIIALGDQLTGSTRASFLLRVAQSSQELDPAKAFAILDHYRSDDLVIQALTDATFASLAASDPPRAEAWLAGLEEGGLRDTTAARFAEGLAERAPEQAFASLQTIANTDLRRDGMRSLVEGYLERDPGGALEFLGTVEIAPEDARFLGVALAKQP